jgi:uncharacterized protein
MGLSGVIDVHVHGYLPEVAADPAAWARARGEDGWLACVLPVGRRSIQGWASVERTIADMDAAGVAAAVLLGWYWQSQATCDEQNRWYAAWRSRYPGRLLAFAAAQPAAGRAAVDGVRRALDMGFCGVGELLPQAQGYTVDSPGFRAVVEVAVERGVPVNLHATDPQAGPAAGPPTPLGDYVRLARDYPTGTFILAHWGGGLAFREGPELPANLYFDTAASPLLYGPEVFLKARARVGPGRILYGSDYPLLLYPRRVREPGFGDFLGAIASCGLEGHELEAVLSGNARRLLGGALAPAAKDV